MAKVKLMCDKLSKPFMDRSLTLDQPIKIGRSVARATVAPNNAIFDCKVVSRNHALLWFENGKFFLQDMKSTNGTFVNKIRLGADPVEIHSNYILRFGTGKMRDDTQDAEDPIIAIFIINEGEEEEQKRAQDFYEEVVVDQIPQDSTPLILDKKTEEDSFDGLEDRNQEEEKAEDDKEPNEETLTSINAAEILDVELGFLKLLLKTRQLEEKLNKEKPNEDENGQLELDDETRQRTNKEEKKQLNYAVTQENLRQIEAVEQSVERMSKRFDDFIEARQEEIPLLMEDDDNNEILTNMTDLEYEILKVEEKTIKDDKLYKEFQKQQTLIRLQYESAIRRQQALSQRHDVILILLFSVIGIVILSLILEFIGSN